MPSPHYTSCNKITSFHVSSLHHCHHKYSLMYILLLEFTFDMNSYSEFPKESFIPEDLKANTYADRQLQGLAVPFP